ncbi:MAG: FAD-binding protein [Caldilineaceae bacterium]
MQIQEIQDAVTSSKAIFAFSGKTKSALRLQHSSATAVDLHPLTGILEYDPGEYTFTALAGTPIAEVEAELAKHGQYLPFDPPLVKAGATLGGTVASGLSGSGRQRYGGVRDFLVGVRFVDGKGQLVRGGGKVVKNAAGFDFPKLMVGSLGQFGVLVELSFKVFPRPQTYMTLKVPQSSLSSAIETLSKLATTVFDIDALDMLMPEPTLLIRLGGWANTLPDRLEHLRRFVGSGEVVTEDNDLWEDAREFSWVPEGSALVKVPLNLHKIAALDARLGTRPRRYSSGGNVAWVSWNGVINEFDSTLTTQNLSGLVVLGEATTKPLIGKRGAQAFYQRIKSALDPLGKFPSF